MNAVHEQSPLGVARGGDRPCSQGQPGQTAISAIGIGDLDPHLPTGPVNLDLASKIQRHAVGTRSPGRLGSLTEGDTLAEPTLLDAETGRIESRDS